mgnify:CR=1 FL=1
MVKQIKSGVIIIDKNSGITSHDVVSLVRKALGIRKVGHCGTLDPLATGLLMICVGKYTRLSPWLMSVDKEYVSTFEFGSYSNTDDADGSITRIEENSQIEESLLRDRLTRFHGEIMQVPPIYSAIRVGGQRSYKRARKGREVKLQPRSVTVNKMDLLRFSYPEATFKIKCSKGTYIRSLARDLGEACGSAGYVRQLRRTKVGSVGIDHAITIEELQKRCDQGDIDSCFTKISDVLIDMPHYHIRNKTESIKRFLNGNPIECETNNQGEHAVFDEEGQLLGIGRISLNMLYPKTIMAITV